MCIIETPYQINAAAVQVQLLRNHTNTTDE